MNFRFGCKSSILIFNLKMSYNNSFAIHVIDNKIDRNAFLYVQLHSHPTSNYVT